MAKASAKRPMLPMPLWMGVSCGIAVGLIVMMLPVALLESIVEQIGLASVLPAAAPPLGQTARGLLAALSGLIMAVSCFVLLRALEGLPPIRIGKSRSRRNANEVIFDTVHSEEAPQPIEIEEMRRGPIMAARDLGAPFHSITAETATASTASEIVTETPLAVEAPLMLEPPLVLEPDMVEAPLDSEWSADLEDAIVVPEPEPMSLDTPDEIMDGAPSGEAEPGTDPEAEVIDPAPIPVSPARAAIEGSIPALVRRLETGFERRAAGREPVPETEPGFTDPQPDIDVALRDALGTLQRMSARSR